ncbi:glycoside hydrolase family 2 protein [Natronoglomus mannanivorans]|uniref:Beta-galactosidase n=1 Tax=Natronoglomus mannanivorans TaxID=2979990 RepID=A0AAP2Z3M8_9EURY|nr:beta-galactosidase [Halobacteria archaeon AArc-xg1-1]
MALAGAVAAGPASTTGAGTSSSHREPARTEIRSIDGTNVVFQYDRPVPSFETWRQDNDYREYRDLDGTWRFRFGDDGVDPREIGVEEGWYRSEYDDSDWNDVAVPLPWDLHETPGFDTYDGDYFGEGTAHRDGYAWYRRSVDVPDSWNGAAVELVFLAAFYSARVYVNGELVGEHEGGHTPFALDVGDHLEPGAENELAVRVYRREWFEDEESASEPEGITGDSELPNAPVDWWPYAGLTRDVYLEATDPVTASKLLVDAADGEVTMRAVVYNAGDEPGTRTVEFDPGTGTGGETATEELEIEAGETRVVETTVEIPDASAWSAASPTTYEATVTLSDADDTTVRDGLSTTYGMRSVTIEDGVLQINGEPVYLKGFNWHEETGASGRSVDESGYDALLDRVREANANFLRNSHYNRHPYVYEYTDEHGLYVMDEADNMWVSAEQQEAQLEYGLSWALAVTTAWNQYNRPSVVMWCTQNESSTEETDVYREWLEEMKDGVDAVDGQNRPVTWATFESHDPSFDLADVVGFNEYYGYFWGENEELSGTLDRLSSEYPDTPILITENGTWSHAPRDGDAGSPYESGTEAWQARNFHEHWVQAASDERADNVVGYTFWALKDYKTREGYNRFDANAVSTMGTMDWGDSDLETHVVYDTIRDAYGAYPDLTDFEIGDDGEETDESESGESDDGRDGGGGDDDGGTADDTADDSVPGFGVLGGATALAGTAYLLERNTTERTK